MNDRAPEHSGLKISPTHWPRAIAHVDMDQFYAAVEILDFPELHGKPVIVGAKGRRGVVSTASYEARAFGVHSAMPSLTAEKLCPHAIWRFPRMERYVEKSREVHAVFERYTDQIEPLSIDEAFLDLTGSLKLFGPPEVIAKRIKAEVLAETGLVASIGIAFNKFLAKIASDLRKPDALVVVPPTDEEARAFLAPLPISRLWGVGPKTRERLNALGFFKIAELARADEKMLARKLGMESAVHLMELAIGQDRRPVECSGQPKSIGRENTFSDDLHEMDLMERELLRFAEDVAQRLRSKELRCMGVTLKVRFGDFSRITRSATFDEPVDLAEPLYKVAARLLRERVKLEGKGVRLLGLSAVRLQNRQQLTASLFSDANADRKRKAASAMDSLRKKFGSDAIMPARLLKKPT